MRIWKLTPTNLTDPIWKTYNPEPIIVRAGTEAEARNLAAFKTSTTIYDPQNFAQPIPINPWSGYRKIEDLAPLPTTCEDITDQTNQYSVDGPAEVLRHTERF